MQVSLWCNPHIENGVFSHPLKKICQIFFSNIRIFFWKASLQSLRFSCGGEVRMQRKTYVFQNIHIQIDTAWNLHKDLDALLEETLKWYQNNIMKPLREFKGKLGPWNMKCTEFSPFPKCSWSAKHILPSCFLLF